MSRKKNRWQIRIIDIQEQIEKINRYSADMSYTDLLGDDKTADAVMRCVQIIGEAVRSIPQDIRDKYSDVPWSKITAMRNILVHEYTKIDINVLYSTITEDIPALEELIEKIPVSEEDI